MALGQLTIDSRGNIRDKVQAAIDRLRTFEPEEGYYLAFSGGKDSQCVYHLAKMAGVKFDAHYAVTSVDPPELVQFIKSHYPDVAFDRQYYSDGEPRHYFNDGRPKPITMWSLIGDHTLPPTRKVRYCCAALKEPGGAERVTVTGVRWAESVRRRDGHGVVVFQNKPKSTMKLADEIGAEYKLNKSGGVIMNDDNDEARRLVEQCYRTRKTIVNPIVDWDEDDVWDFLNSNGIEHCCLYDEGFTRLGCIGCPLAGSKNMIRDFERWPKYKQLYILAFEKMIENHPGQIRILDPDSDTKFKLDVFEGAKDDDVAKSQKKRRCSDSLSRTAINQRSHVQKMDQGQPVLKTSTIAGWKWARCEDTRWMFNLWLNDELNGTIFGLTKEDLHDAD